VRSERGHLDLPRAREGGLAGGFFAINSPPDMSGVMQPESDFARTEAGYEMRLATAIDPAFAQRFTIGALASALKLEAESAGQVKIVRTIAELEACVRSGVLAVVLHLEGAEAIDPDLNALHVFHAAGLRSLGIVWSRPNSFGEGVPFAYPRTPDTGSGLTDAGRALVRACNQLGVLLDLAHLNEQGFWDVAALSDAPLVVTHAGVHAICPSTRNLTDKQLDAIGASDGVIGIIFDVTNIRADGDLNQDTPLTAIVRHVAYVADHIGVEHVALGSDFDGADMPNELHDATGLPKLLAALRAAGFDVAALRQIADDNWMRVLRRTWR
jgi:membrane dipeptidase